MFTPISRNKSICCIPRPAERATLALRWLWLLEDCEGSRSAHKSQKKHEHGSTCSSFEGNHPPSTKQAEPPTPAADFDAEDEETSQPATKAERLSRLSIPPIAHLPDGVEPLQEHRRRLRGRVRVRPQPEHVAERAPLLLHEDLEARQGAVVRVHVQLARAHPEFKISDFGEYFNL